MILVKSMNHPTTMVHKQYKNYGCKMKDQKIARHFQNNGTPLYLIETHCALLDLTTVKENVQVFEERILQGRR